MENISMQLRKMTESEFQSYLEYTYVKYADEQAKAGFWPADRAIELAKAEITDLLPDGLATKDHFLYCLVVPGEPAPVGVLWIMIRVRNGRREAFIDDIEIYENFRRKGYASQALGILENIITEMGLKTIRLHVFGHNQNALKLYEKCGYEIINIYMEKSVA
jgi:ribosomal protein S18 acetylase RimI-like enzyme